LTHSPVNKVRPTQSHWRSDHNDQARNSRPRIGSNWNWLRMRKRPEVDGTDATARYLSSWVAAMNCSTAVSCSPRVAYIRPIFVRIFDESAMHWEGSEKKRRGNKDDDRQRKAQDSAGNPPRRRP
jgi:hypothetical protein